MKCHVKMEISRADLVQLVRLKVDEADDVGAAPFTYPTRENAETMAMVLTKDGIELSWSEEVQP